MLYHLLTKHRNELIKQINIIENKLLSYPEGEILCVKNGSYTKWYKSNGTSPIYITKKERFLAELLAIKKYYSLQLEDLEQELSLLNHYLIQYQKINNKSKILLENPNYSELLKNNFQTFSPEIQKWVNSNYEHNTNHPENLIHKTLSGQHVRSKSEVIIANALYLNKIPYRYECALHLDNFVLYPDFLICHPKTLQLFYWEHFGLMNNHSYSEASFNKLKTYANHNIIPSINLITTYETIDNPIDSEKIQQIIYDYFM